MRILELDGKSVNEMLTKRAFSISGNINSAPLDLRWKMGRIQFRMGLSKIPHSGEGGGPLQGTSGREQNPPEAGRDLGYSTHLSIQSLPSHQSKPQNPAQVNFPQEKRERSHWERRMTSLLNKHILSP